MVSITWFQARTEIYTFFVIPHSSDIFNIFVLLYLQALAWEGTCLYVL